MVKQLLRLTETNAYSEKPIIGRQVTVVPMRLLGIGNTGNKKR